MLVEDCKVIMSISLSDLVPNWLKEIPDHLKTQEMLQRGSARRVILIRIFSELFQDPKDVLQKRTQRTIFIAICPPNFQSQEICVKEVN